MQIVDEAFEASAPEEDDSVRKNRISEEQILRVQQEQAAGQAATRPIQPGLLQ